MKFKIAALVFALAGMASAAGATPMPAPAKPVSPAKPVPTQLYSGRWYEIARTPNMMQKDCQASTSDFSGWASSGVFQVVQTCHKGSISGPKQTYSAKGHVLPATANAKMKLGFMGGLISQEYWILDHADNNNWLIMATANEHYVWLLSRVPVLSAAEKAHATARLQQMGFSLAHMTFPQQIAAR